jgi:hypothetical protein
MSFPFFIPFILSNIKNLTIIVSLKYQQVFRYNEYREVL